jgi:hypothetical protein
MQDTFLEYFVLALYLLCVLSVVAGVACIVDWVIYIVEELCKEST